MSLVVLLISWLLGWGSCATRPGHGAEEAILAQEREALERWSSGDLEGYAQNAAEDVTYFDDIAAATRIDGLEAWRSYLASLDGQVPRHRYEIINPKVQVYGDLGILTLHYHAFALDGTPLARWKATSVYRLENEDDWRVVHAHWSLIKEP